MRAIDVIYKKRNGGSLSEEEIRFFIEGFTKGDIPDYQASALMMAIYFNHMNKEETLSLVKAMVDSGDTMDLSRIKGIKCDKHSTGGVGDKTTVVLAPLVAYFGVPVAKMSGRGLGHTGGTLDKLEAIPGFSTGLSEERFIENVNRHGIAVAGQTGELVPADKKLYALRDVTATVENTSLIAASIMSKKLASGADKIVLDVKTGKGAFMKTMEDSLELAEAMVEIGTMYGRHTLALITDMNEPLGSAVGNSLEVIEAIETLKGRGPKDLTELCIELAVHMLLLAERFETYQEAKSAIEDAIFNKKALDKLKEFIEVQGGDPRVADDYSLFPQGSKQEVVVSDKEGYVHDIDAEQIGHCAMLLGAGRKTKDDDIDLGVGLVLNKKTGDFVKQGDVLATLYYNEGDPSQIGQLLQKSFAISKEKGKNKKILYFLVKSIDGRIVQEEIV